MMELGIKDIRKFNPQYHQDGTLVWKKIGVKIGENRVRQKAKFNLIEIDQIKPNDFKTKIDKGILSKSREIYGETHEMIPVFLNWNLELIGGFEQYALAKELDLQKIPFLKKGENKKKSNKNKGKKRTVKAFDGESFKVSINKEKKIRQTKQMVSKLKLNLKMLSPKKFLVLDNSGNCVIGSPKNGTSLNTIRKKLGLMIEEKKNKSKQISK